MSLINKMLQDLDARGSAPGVSAQPDLKSVVREGRNPVPMAALGAAALVAVAVAGAVGYWWVKRPASVVAIGPQVSAPIKGIQEIPPVVVEAEPIVAASPPMEPEPEPEPESEAESEPEAPSAPVAKPARAVRVAAAAPTPVSVPVPPRPQPAVETGRQMTPRQRAESEYNRALASLQDGCVGDAVASLEQAIAIEPRHDAARQTLVGLLVEAGRMGPAMRVLQNGLTLDPRQPSMAMLLARLQIEGGTSGIDTLMRTLPYAQGNSEYHAFLAAALARDERHREAAEQYQAALRGMPANGVWWMGLGVSLQAEKRIAEAVAAFERARSSPNLTPQLRTFVDRRLELLSR